MPKKSNSTSGGGKGAAKKGDAASRPGTAAPTAPDPMVEAKLWAARFKISEQSRKEHRSNAVSLVEENERLRDHLQEAERDTIEVIAFLKKELGEKDNEITDLQAQLSTVKRESRLEKDAIAASFNRQLAELEDKLEDQAQEISKLQTELIKVADFRKNRSRLERELQELKESSDVAEEQHLDAIQRTEARFYEQKLKLQRQQEEKILEVAEEAKLEAMKKLQEQTRHTFKENARLKDELKLNVQENAKLKEINAALLSEQNATRESTAAKDKLLQEAVNRAAVFERRASQQQEKIAALEAHLSAVVRQLDQEKIAHEQATQADVENARAEADAMRQTLDLRTAEMNRIKALARNVLDQRSEVELFLVDTMRYIKDEIAASREQYRKDAMTIYQQELRDGLKTGKLPRIKTFHNASASTNSIANDFSGAEVLDREVDVKDMTWEQRERVVQQLLAQINGASKDPQLQGSRHQPAPRSHAATAHPLVLQLRPEPGLPGSAATPPGGLRTTLPRLQGPGSGQARRLRKPALGSATSRGTPSHAVGAIEPYTGGAASPNIVGTAIGEPTQSPTAGQLALTSS